MPPKWLLPEHKYDTSEAMNSIKSRKPNIVWLKIENILDLWGRKQWMRMLILARQYETQSKVLAEI